MELGLAGFVSVSSIAGHATLLNHVTWEKRVLEGQPSQWRLEPGDAEDQMMLVNMVDGSRSDCAECFTLGVVIDLDEETLVIDTGKSLAPFNEVMCQNDPLDVNLRSLGMDRSMRVWAFRRSQNGARCWWSLPDLFLAADKPYNMSPSQWYHSWWKWWGTTLEQLGLD